MEGRGRGEGPSRGEKRTRGKKGREIEKERPMTDGSRRSIMSSPPQAHSSPRLRRGIEGDARRKEGDQTKGKKNTIRRDKHASGNAVRTSWHRKKKQRKKTEW